MSKRDSSTEQNAKGQPCKAGLRQRPLQGSLLGGVIANPNPSQNYMKSHVNGQAAAATAAPTTYRRELLDLLAASPVIMTEEYETATRHILVCQSLSTLQKWYRNCIREIARREEEVLAAQAVAYATAEQKEEIVKLANSVYILRAEKTKAVLGLLRYDYAQAVAVIGYLWAKILHRQERAAEGSSEAHQSFSNAA